MGTCLSFAEEFCSLYLEFGCVIQPRVCCLLHRETYRKKNRKMDHGAFCDAPYSDESPGRNADFEPMNLACKFQQHKNPLLRNQLA